MIKSNYARDVNLDDPALLQSSKHNQNKMGRGNVRVYQPGKITVRFASFEPSPYTKQCQKEKALCSFRRRSVMKKYEYTNTDATPKSFDLQRIERVTKAGLAVSFFWMTFATFWLLGATGLVSIFVFCSFEPAPFRRPISIVKQNWKGKALCMLPQAVDYV